MIENYEDSVLVGIFIGFRKIHPFSKMIKAQFKVDSKIIEVPVDYRQKAFIQKEHSVGSHVAIGFFGGEWHIGSKPMQTNFFLKMPDIS